MILDKNIFLHKKWIELAIAARAEVILFPELSVTGYEPALAKELAIEPDDQRFNDFQILSDQHNICIFIGAPVKQHNGICISLLLFQPHTERGFYHKHHIHADEEPFFIKGKPFEGRLPNQMALAICYEISIPEHAENAAKKGARMYLASVAKSVSGVEKACETLSKIAATYSMPVFMSNCVGRSDNFDCGGKSAVWDTNGELVASLNTTEEGMLMYDTESGTILHNHTSDNMGVYPSL